MSSQRFWNVTLVVCEAFPAIPHSLTPFGRTLEEPLRALSLWTEQHMAEVHVSQQALDAKSA